MTTVLVIAYSKLRQLFRSFSSHAATTICFQPLKLEVDELVLNFSSMRLIKIIGRFVTWLGVYYYFPTQKGRNASQIAHVWALTVFVPIEAIYCGLLTVTFISTRAAAFTAMVCVHSEKRELQSFLYCIRTHFMTSSHCVNKSDILMLLSSSHPNII